MTELCTGALFFAMRSCEYLQVSGPRKTKLLTVRNIRFFIKNSEIMKTGPNAKLILTASTVTVTYVSQKNQVKNVDIKNVM